MEALAGISSAFAVVSLAGQLADGLQKLVRFWKSVQDVPGHFADLSHELQLLSSVIANSRLIGERGEVDENTEEILHVCENKIKNLQDTVNRALALCGGKGKCKRTLAAIRTVLNADEILDLKRFISETISTLQVAQNNSLIGLAVRSLNTQKEAVAIATSIEHTLQKYVEQIEDRNLKVNMRITNETFPLDDGAQPLQQLQLGQFSKLDLKIEGNLAPKGLLDKYGNLACQPFDDTGNGTSVARQPPCSVLRRRETINRWSLSTYTPFLTLHSGSRSHTVITETPSNSHTKIEKEYQFVLYPPSWLTMLGLACGMKLSADFASGWKYSLQPFRAVPADSLVFEFCREGNLGGLRTLLKRGDCSPWDRDPDGRTPLWVAVKSASLEVAELLLQEGADPHARDWRYDREPIANTFDHRNTTLSTHLSMLRLVRTHASELDESTTHRLATYGLISYRPHLFSPTLSSTAALQITTLLLPNLPPHHPERFFILLLAIFFLFDKSVLHLILRNCSADIEILKEGHSVLHEAIAKHLLERDPISMKMIIAKTKPLHLHAYAFQQGSCRDEKPRTPTMLCMFDAGLFWLWRKALEERGVDVGEFVRRELEVGGLREEGWDEEGLIRLFKLRYVPKEKGETLMGFPNCQRCGNKGTRVGSCQMVDLEWRRTLRLVRRGLNNGSNAREDGLVDYENRGDGPPLYEATDGGDEAPWRFVCSSPCLDGACVAWMYDDAIYDEEKVEERDSNYEKDLVKGFVEETVEKTECPSWNIPGSYVE